MLKGQIEVMDLDKLEKLAQIVLKDLPNSSSPLRYHMNNYSKFNNLMVVAAQTIPEYETLFNTSLQNSANTEGWDAISIITHLLQLIKLEKDSLNKAQLSSKEGRIFDNVEDKLKQGVNHFKREDYVSTFNCLNSAFELVVKDKVGIPTTIPNINTANIIEVLVKHRVEPYLFFNEVRKRVIDIDNKVKHQGYSPSKIDAINGIKAMEDLIAQLKGRDLVLSDEVRAKICEGL
jgi:hypothetical protein